MKTSVKTLAALLMAAVVSTSAKADEENTLHWRKPNAFAWSLHAAATLSLALDVSTALDIKNHQHEQYAWGWTYHHVEPNPILGEHPSDLKLVGYFFGVSIIHTAIWLAMPEELRWIPDTIMLMVEIPQVAGNRANGLSFKLPF